MTEGLKIPSRHLGLTLTAKRSMNTLIEQAAELVGKYVDLDKLLSICHRNFPCRYTLPYSSETGVESFTPSAKKMKIAIARDPAFNFIYRENIDRLSALGSITYFSPVYGSDLPDADLVYLPGGYPELFARQLHRRQKVNGSIKNLCRGGGENFGRVWRYDVSHPFPDSPPGRDCICHDGYFAFGLYHGGCQTSSRISSYRI